MGYEIDKAAEELLAIVQSPNTSRKLLDSILDEHEKCMADRDECDVCEYITDELFESLLHSMAPNPVLSPDQQARLLDFATKERQEDPFLLYLAENPNLSDAMKENLLDVSTLPAVDASGFLSSLLRRIQENPRFTKDDERAFKNDVNEYYDWEDSDWIEED